MKKYLIALSLVGLVTTSCYEKLNITPPNSITNEQVLKLLETADDKTIVTIMGAMTHYRVRSTAAVMISGAISMSRTLPASSAAKTLPVTM